MLTTILHTRIMVNIPEIWSTNHRYGQNTKNMVKIPDTWSKYQKDGKHTRNTVSIPEIWAIPEIWSTYQTYGQHTRNMVNIPEIQLIYKKYGQPGQNVSLHQATGTKCLPQFRHPWTICSWAGTICHRDNMSKDKMYPGTKCLRTKCPLTKWRL